MRGSLTLNEFRLYCDEEDCQLDKQWITYMLCANHPEGERQRYEWVRVYHGGAMVLSLRHAVAAMELAP